VFLVVIQVEKLSLFLLQWGLDKWICALIYFLNELSVKCLGPGRLKIREKRINNINHSVLVS
jgi:hypothetical protein